MFFTNAGLLSATLAQHLANIGSLYRVCGEAYIGFAHSYLWQLGLILAVRKKIQYTSVVNDQNIGSMCMLCIPFVYKNQHMLILFQRNMFV